MGDKQLGYVRRSANFLGITVDVYLAEIAAGRKWCIRCRAWHERSMFGADRHQGDGLNQSCRASFRVKEKRYRRTRGTTGMKLSPDTRARMSAAHAGSKNNNWKGGVTPAIRRARQHALYQQWRRAVFARDGYICVGCGSTTRLHAHHIKSFKDHPELRLDIDNGQTLCAPCHRDVHAGDARGG